MAIEGEDALDGSRAAIAAKGGSGSRIKIPVVVVADPAGAPLGSKPTGTDRSGAIVAGGQFQKVADANPNRKYLGGQNISGGDLWAREQLTATVGAGPTVPGSYRIPAGGTFEANYNAVFWIWGATTGQAFSADEA